MKNVTFNTGQNEMWEVERVYPVERASYWWTKPQLKLIRDDYKNEVMMEGVRNLVKARLEQEEKDPHAIDERVEEVMQLDHGSIANFLQSVPNKSEKPSTNFNPNLNSHNESNSISSSDSDSENDSNSDFDSDYDSDTDIDSDSDTDSDSESSSSASSSASAVKEYERENADRGGTQTSHSITTKTAAPLLNGCIDKSTMQSSSDDDNNSQSSSSSSSSSDNASSSQSDGLITAKSHNEKCNMHIIKTAMHDLNNPIRNVRETVISSKENFVTSVKKASQESKSILNENNHLNASKQIRKLKTECELENEARISGKNRFKQGVLVVLAIERLQRLVTRDGPPLSSMYETLSSSSRLTDMYLPSDDENEEDVNSTYGDSSECPVCLGLVDAEQQRKIILLRQLLCKECFFLHFINRDREHRILNNDGKAS